MSGPKVAVLGANGRMGRAVVRLAHEAGMPVVLAIGHGPEVGRDAGELAGVGSLGVSVQSTFDGLAASGAEVLVDFSTPGVVAKACAACVDAKVAVVSGTTGIGDDVNAALESASRDVPVLWEPNMSVGVFVLGKLLAQAIAMLGPEYDVELVEAHHRMKVDAPSGTALRLAEIAKSARAAFGETPRLVTGREGKPGTRSKEEIGVLALRGGDVIGDHTAMLLSSGDRIELVHRASSRDLFARGALRAAGWIAGRRPGRYTLANVLGD